jgi:hypothetical protein
VIAGQGSDKRYGYGYGYEPDRRAPEPEVVA